MIMTKYLKIDKKKVAKALVTTLPIDSPAFYGNIPRGIYGKITRAEYEKLCLVSARTANRELGVLFKKNLVEKKGKGPETYYVLARSGEIWRDKRRG